MFLMVPAGLSSSVLLAGVFMARILAFLAPSLPVVLHFS
jgi:hypothetical protein